MVLRLSAALSLVALLILAGLQYHWIGQIAIAERQRLERRVEEASLDFADDFSNELRQLAGIFEPRFSPVASDPVSIATRYHYWVTSAPYPSLLKSLYIVRSPTDVLRLDPVAEVFVPDAWPDVLPPVADFGSRGYPRGFESDLIVVPLNRRPLGQRGPGGRGGPGPEFSAPRGGGALLDREPNDNAWVVVQLDREVIVKQILPRLVARRFPEYEGRDYRVAVVELRPDMASQVVFTSGDAWSDEDLETPDYALDLLAPGPQLRRGGGVQGSGIGGTGPRGARGDQWRGPDQRAAFAGRSWQVLVKHRAGSVATAVTEFRRRNLAISFGVLVVLGVSAVVIAISSSRARRLGKLQMEFAAGISHELRTPLAVIQSAAHNLGAGVVKDRGDIEEYAAIVKTEARRLTDMVEQVMAYTETQSGRKHYDLSPVHVGDVADLAMRNMSTVLQEGNTVVKKNIDAAVPPVLADAPALTRCLQNLLSNAIKYGQNNNQANVEIAARHVAEPGSGGTVQLIVTDHGHGVPERDVRHLFEAFHRGANATTNTPGNGLGLHLVDRIMKAQN
ncbi:MAG TPA: HAMP domain-containing sensor histidine kinase, partial [Terriglobia bacterium]|nr:HAMP domain-containing sensor histidine kinase [Terriglobia bacterium]